MVAHEAMQLGIEKAKQHGMAAIALRNAHHVGRIGYWAEQCAAAGLISIHFVSVIGDPMVAPVPREGQPLRHQPAVRGVSPRGPSAAAAGLRHQRHRLW